MTHMLGFELNNVAECELFLMPEIYAEANAFRVSDVLVSRIPFSDWHLIEKSRYTDDLADVYAHRSPPYFCIFAEPSLSSQADVAASMRTMRIAKVRVLTLALRLTTDLAVPVVDPCDFVSYQRRGHDVARTVSRRGRAGYELRPRVDVGELVDDWARAYEALTFLSSFRRRGRLALALELYFESASDFITDDTSQLLLHAALEALCGSSVGRLAEVRWGDEGVSDSIRSRRIRRNRLAHGVRSDWSSDSVALRRVAGWALIESVRQELTTPSGDGSLDAGLIDALKDADEFGVARLRVLPVDEERLLYGAFGRHNAEAD
ncbi:hypothetical protein ACLQ2Q_13395 [Microbacterium sp. DT81.1]|uniref:hypothetical protein n=1 Tax=Microbacterium sp. DT81.1 TaxID=3393413 RepID=UPI003CEA08E8